MKINDLTVAEENLMLVLWKLESAYMKDIMENLPEPKPHQNTVSTFLKILVEKSFLETKKEGRIFNYRVTVPFEVYKKHKLENFLSSYYNGSAKDLLLHILTAKMVSEDDLKEIFERNIFEKPKKEMTDKDIFIEKEIKKIHTKKDKKKKKNKKKKI